MKPTPVRRILWVLAIVLALVLLMAGLAQAKEPNPKTLAPSAATAATADVFPLTVQDDSGRRVQLARTPQRIVSLLPSLTETVCALGACERMVGVDRYSNWPAKVRDLPMVGDGLAPNVEAIVALRPDLVLVSQSVRTAQRLQALGLQVLMLEPRSYADLRRSIALLGQVLAVPDAQRLWHSIDAGMQAAAQSVAPPARGARVYFEVNSGPYAAAPQSFVGQTLARLGAANIVADDGGPFPKINPELVVRAQPDVLMAGSHSAASMAGRPGWAALQAVRDQRVCVFAPEQMDLLVRAGPRMAEGAHLMAQCLNQHSVAVAPSESEPVRGSAASGSGRR